MPNLSEFDPDGDLRNVSNRWTKWVHDFRAAMVSFKITCEKRQRALLRFYGGDELTDILESLDDTGTDEEIEPQSPRRLRLLQGILAQQEIVKKKVTVVMRKIKSAVAMFVDTVEKYTTSHDAVVVQYSLLDHTQKEINQM